VNADSLLLQALEAFHFVEQCKLGLQLAERDLEFARMLEEDAQEMLDDAKQSLRDLMQQLTTTQQAELLQVVLEQS
jgi:putative heme iron utilization protein